LKPPARRGGVDRLTVEEELRFLDQAYARDGHRITPGLVACLSPYMREHIRRFGQYVLDMEEMPRPFNLQPLPFKQAL
jgi:hypothetical protein